MVPFRKLLIDFVIDLFYNISNRVVITCNYHSIRIRNCIPFTPMSVIERDIPQPLHSQLTEILRQRISDEFYPAESRFPSERMLCEEFGVSRTTVREVLRQLKKEGLIFVLAGRGAYVKTAQREIAVHVSLGGFSADLNKEGKLPRSRLLKAEILTTIPPDIKKELGLRVGDEVVKIERLRLDNDIPLALHTVYLNHRLCPQILNNNLSQSSLFSILRDQYQLKITKARQLVFAALANGEERKLLNLSNPSAVLHAQRITYIDSGEVIEYSIATYCGDFYRLVVDLDGEERSQ